MNTTDKSRNSEAYRERLEEIKHMTPDNTMLYEDPAVVNPEELATFPKPAPKADATEIADENQARPVSVQRSAVREGRNIVRTDTAPDPDGFM
nr:hypothetical protein [uncultured Flavobacterium sp.]